MTGAHQRSDDAVRPVQVVIVAYHNTDDLTECLSALGSSLPVVVVDNGGDSGAAAAAATHGAHYLAPAGNIGFAAGVNAGVRAGAPGSDVLLVNPDARLAADSVKGLQQLLSSDPRLAAVSPRLLGRSGWEQVSWPLPSPLRACLEAVGAGRFAPSRRHFVVGAVLLIRREAWNDVGGFDERYFLYAEEADWQRRALARGWRVQVAGQIVADHSGAGSSSDEGKRQLYFHRSTEIFIRKWYGPRGWAVFRGAVVVGAAVRAVIHPSSRQRHREKMALYVRGPRAEVARRGLG